MTKKNLVVVSIVDGFHYRYLCQSGIVDNLISENVELIFITASNLIESLKSDYGSYIRKIYVFEEVTLTFSKRLYLASKLISNKKLSSTLNIKNELQEKSLSNRILSFLNYAGILCVFNKLLINSFGSCYYRKIFDEFDIDLLISSTPGQKIADIPLLLEAKRRKIKTISPVYSWDNLTAKGPFAVNPDYLIVWNDVLKNEAIHYHDYEQGEVKIGGVPIYDIYKNVKINELGKKIDFCRKLGFLTPELPLITVTTIPRVYFGDGHVELCELITKAIKDNQLPDCNILLRPHPMDDTDYSSLLIPNLIVDNYGSEPDSSLAKWLPDKSNSYYLGETMLHSDLVINVASTITIDASWFDTPIINVAFDIADSTYIGSIARYYDYTHYQEVVKTKAANLVYKKEDFIDCIKFNLNNPEQYKLEREQLIQQQCLGYDFNATKATSEILIDILPR